VCCDDNYTLIEKLQTRKKNAVELSKSINVTKKQIDDLRGQVEEMNKKRLETTGDLITDNGEVVMDEDEYTAIVELKKVGTSLLIISVIKLFYTDETSISIII